MVPKSPTEQLRLGTFIDGGSLELVEVLGVGGYGVVYRAVETGASSRKSYAVKCLTHNQNQPSMRRQHHIREIALHQLSSAHPGVVTLHRVIEDADYTYIIMDYAPDHDLFTQILNNCRYLGNDALIKHVFMQLIDAVEYCHSLGIYHRDLKPENVLCFNNGSRVAITDFGLATTEKVSTEMRTGSIYHMSPECQGDEFSTGKYSPMFNDIWSLGIILLNLATGRNPWKTATLNDETFCEYLRNPLNFFPSVLPISHEVNEILIRMLHVNWTERMTLAELRQEMEDVRSFYHPDVIFDGSQARCPWEAQAAEEEAQGCFRPDEMLKSHWSEDSQLGCESLEVPELVAQATKWAVNYKDLGFPSFESDADSDLSLTVDLPSSQQSSNSSMYSDSPSTPDNADISFANCYPTPGEVVVDSDERQAQEKGRVSSPLGPSILDMESPSRYQGISPDSPTLHDRGGHGDKMWGSGSSTEAGCDMGLASPSPELFTWPHESASAAVQVAVHVASYGSQKTGPIALDPINFSTSCSRRRPNPVGEEGLVTPTHTLKAVQIEKPWSKVGEGTRALKEVQANDNRRRKLSPLGSVKYWFSPSKLFF